MLLNPVEEVHSERLQEDLITLATKPLLSLWSV